MCVHVHPRPRPAPPPLPLPLPAHNGQVLVDHRGGKVECSDPALRARVERSLERLAAAIRPAPVERPHH